MIKRFCILIFVSILFTACNSTGIKRRVSSLDDAITDYNVGLRWSMLNRIESHHLGKDGERKAMDRSTMDNIRVTGYDILDIIFNDEADEAAVSGEVKYYTTETGTLKTLSFTHVWWYDGDQKRWFNASEYLDLK